MSDISEDKKVYNYGPQNPSFGRERLHQNCNVNNKEESKKDRKELQKDRSQFARTYRPKIFIEES